MKNYTEFCLFQMLTVSFFSSFLHFYFCNYFSPFFFPPLPPLIGEKHKKENTGSQKLINILDLSEEN